jgi:hypothetical protein
MKVQRAVLALVIAAVSVGAGGCVMHYLMPHAHPPAASEFGQGPRTSAAGHYVATLVPEAPLKVRELQSVRLDVVDAKGVPVDGAAIAVDGGMPAHGHGLPTQPRVTRGLGHGGYLVEGLRFNMGGWWVLTFQVDGAAGPDSVTFNLDL